MHHREARPAGGRGRSQDAHALGREGERRAAAYLETRGYRVIARNVRADGVELDLVATRGRLAVVVEVKTRRDRRAGAGHEAVDRRKQARLRRGALAWWRAERRCQGGLRIDVVCCYAEPRGWIVEHWPGVC